MSIFNLIRPKLAEKKGIHLAWDFLWRFFTRPLNDQSQSLKNVPAGTFLTGKVLKR